MSTRDLIQIVSAHALSVLGILAIPPVLSFLLSVLHAPGRGGSSPWKHLYAAMVYAACIPGILALVLTGYTLFFTHENLLDVNLVAYLSPIASMGLTLALIGRAVSFSEIPGFHRLSGLMTMIAAAFVIALAISRTRIWLVFGRSIFVFFALAAVVFGILKAGAYMAFHKDDDPASSRRGSPPH